MHFECHSTLGWAIANLGGVDRRARGYAVVGAILPDIDAIPYLWGPEHYARLHHTFGHNVFLWAAFVAWVGFKCRSWRAASLSFLTFGSHLLTDAQFSGWYQYLFWPFSREGFLFPAAVQLGAPINTQMVYLSFMLLVIIALAYRRTPLEFFSPKLDRLVISVFHRRRWTCAHCHGKSNQTCSKCQQPVCFKHGTLGRGWSIVCGSCRNG